MSESRRIAVRTAAVYLLVSSVWIIASDTLANMLPPAVSSVVQPLKGLAFVVATTAVLYLLVERLSARAAQEMVRSTSVERLLGQVVSTVPVGVILTSEDGTVTFVNATAQEMLGVSEAQAVGRGLDVLCCRNADDAASRIGELMRTGVAEDIEVGGPDVTRTVLARAAKVDPAMAASGWVIAIADITDAHRSRAAAERLIAGYAFLTSALRLCVHVQDDRKLLQQIAELAVSTGRYQAAWAVACDDRSGRVEDVALVGMGTRASGIARLMRERAKSAAQPVDEHFTSSDIIISNDIERDPVSPWYPAAREEGLRSLCTLSVSSGGALCASLTLFSRDVAAFDQREVELLSTLRDELAFAIERSRLERRRLEAEEEAAAGERGYRELFSNHPAPMWIYDLETLRFLAINDAAIHKYGYSRQRFMDMSIADIRPPGDVMRLQQNVAAVSSGFEDAGVWEHRDFWGRTFPVHVYSHTLEWEGRKAELVMALEVARME